jgi:S-DNA-T family DNA segregation ATPase FtsK/SpoIIIE
MSGGSKMIRVHGPFCSDTEIENIVNYIKNQDLSEFEESEQISFEVAVPNSVNSDDEDGLSSGNSDDDLYNRAVMIVRRDKKPSISYVQRQLRIGYNRAATLIEKMEENGIISPPNISGKREIIEE